MALLSALVIPLPTAFTSFEDSLIFVLHSSTVFKATGPQHTSTLSSHTLHQLKGMCYVLAAVAARVEKEVPMAPVLLNLYALLKLLSLIEHRRDPALFTPLCALWSHSTDVQGLLKAVPPFPSSFPSPSSESLAFDEKVLLAYLLQLNIMAVRNGNALAATMCLHTMAHYVATLRNSLYAPLLTHKLRLLAGFLTASHGDWLFVHYGSNPEAFLQEIKEVLEAMGV